jgi:hypothetical protein
MKVLRLVAALVAPALVFAALAIEPPQSAPGEPPKPEPATQEPRPAEAEPEEESVPAEEPAADAEELPPLPPETAPPGPSPQRFNPTEKVRADFPVSFPIDI